MKTLNVTNGADKILFNYASLVLSDFKMPLTATIMGIAYGGEVEMIAQLWKDRGHVYGYDVFQDLHPGHVFKGEMEDEFEKNCMQSWYDHPDYGTKELHIDYQRSCLKKEGLEEYATLIKGEVNKHSCDNLDKIHLSFMDMDMLESMKAGYSAVEDKIVKGGYLLMHDVTPIDHMKRLYNWAQKLVKEDEWECVERINKSYLLVLKRK